MNKKRNIFDTVMSVMLTIIFFACNEEVAVSGITLNQTALTLTLGDTSVLKATVDPENATVQTVTWSAEPAGVVTLKAEGNGCTVTPVENGTVTVTVSAGTAEAVCTIDSRVYIGNTGFITAVRDQCLWTKESDGRVKLTEENRAAMAKVGNLTIFGSDVTDLSGIEYFTGLTFLECIATRLTSPDLSGCTSLSTLQCGNQTRDGVEAQTLTLTLNEGQQATWDADWKNNGFNNNVTVAQ